MPAAGSGAPPVLVLITADPRVSHRAAEALRIATGVVAGSTPVTLVLAGDAVHLLDDDTDGLVDGDDVARFRDSLRALGVPFHVEAGAVPADPAGNATRHPVVPVSREEIGALVRGARRCLMF